MGEPPRPLPVSRRAAVGMGLATGFLALAACQTPPANVLPSLTFSSSPPLPLDVATLMVETPYESGAAAPNLQPLSGEPAEDELNEPVSAIVERWARQRFFAVGRSGTARMVVEQADLRRELLARSRGLRGIVTLDQSDRYSTALAVRMVLENPDGARSGFAWAAVTRSVSMAENVTLAQRQERVFTMMEQAITDLDQRLVAEMREKVSSFVLR